MRVIPLLSALLFVLGIGTPSKEASACVIKADAANIDSLVVRPAGEAPFRLTVRQLPLEVKPGKGGQAQVSLAFPLLFSTSHGIQKLDIRVAKRSSLLEGRLIIAKGGAPSFIAGHEAGASDSVALKLPMVELMPEAPIRVPCSALTVSGDDDPPSAPDLVLPGTKISFLSGDARLPLYAEPIEKSPLWIRFAGALQVVGGKEGWLRVQAKWRDGSSLQGWIPSRLAQVHKDRPAQGGVLLGGLRGFGTCGRSHGPSLVKFKLRAGAPIHNRAKGAIWAHAAANIEVKAFALRRSDGWLQIASIEGLPPPPCSEHSAFWVHASDLVWTAKPLE